MEHAPGYPNKNQEKKSNCVLTRGVRTIRLSLKAW